MDEGRKRVAVGDDAVDALDRGVELVADSETVDEKQWRGDFWVEVSGFSNFSGEQGLDGLGAGRAVARETEFCGGKFGGVEILGEETSLGGFARAVDALDREEE